MKLSKDVAKFHEAWAYPDKNVKNISAFKKK